MGQIILTLSAEDEAEIKSALLKLKNHLDQRKVVWNRIPVEKCRDWVLSDKDEIISLAWDIFQYLDSNFFNRKDELKNA